MQRYFSSVLFAVFAFNLQNVLVLKTYPVVSRLHVQQQQQQSGTETDGASCSESVHTNQTGGSSSYMLPAPAYINPPSFEEYTKRSRAVYSASRDRLNEDPAHQDNAVKEPGGGGGFHVRTRSQSSLKQQFEPQENGYTHSQSSLKHQFEQQETEFQIRTVSQSGSKQHFDHESDEDVSIEKPSLSSTPSEQEFHVQLEGKMAQAIATGTFVWPEPHMHTYTHPAKDNIIPTSVVLHYLYPRTVN